MQETEPEKELEIGTDSSDPHNLISEQYLLLQQSSTKGESEPMNWNEASSLLALALNSSWILPSS